MLKNKKYLLFLLITFLMCLLSVIFHELGHAIIYKIQGFNIDFNLTQANPVSGELTLLGSMGGFLTNLIFALIFLLLFRKYKNILLFSVVFAHTWFARIFIYLLKLPRGYLPADEKFIADYLNIAPLLLCLLILIVFSLILYQAVKIIFEKYSKSNSLKILIYSFIASLLAMFVIIPLEG